VPAPLVEDGEDLRFAVDAALRGRGPAVDVTSGRPAADGMLFVTEDGCLVFDRMLPSDDATGSVPGMRCEGRTGRTAPQLFLTARDTAAVQGAGYRLVTVDDAGPGVPPEQVRSLFERFRGGSGSSGLGLSIAAWVAQAHGGSLSVTGSARGGARFLLRVPARKRP
jgi:hypothetical protein